MFLQVQELAQGHAFTLMLTSREELRRSAPRACLSALCSCCHELYSMRNACNEAFVLLCEHTTQDSYYPDFFLIRPGQPELRLEAGQDIQGSQHSQSSLVYSCQHRPQGLFPQISLSSVLHTFVPPQLKLLVA